MIEEPEDYIPPVGFASEPTAERRRWAGRAILVLFLAGLLWMVTFRICNPPEDTGPGPVDNVLPGPR